MYQRDVFANARGSELICLFLVLSDLYLCSQGRQIFWDSQTHLQSNHVRSIIASQIWNFRRNADRDVLKANIQNPVLHWLRTWNKVGFQHRMLVIAVILIFAVHAMCQTLHHLHDYNPWSCKTNFSYYSVQNNKRNEVKIARQKCDSKGCKGNKDASVCIFFQSLNFIMEVLKQEVLKKGTT